MSTIAKKLCNDIVDPILSSSEVNDKIDLHISQNDRVIPSLYSQKKKVVNKNLSHNSNTSNRLNTTKIVLKKYFNNSAINTEISGPLRCDNNCVTVVRKRDNFVICKCNNIQQSSKHRSKQIQTIYKKSASLLDKSCTHCIETVSCGTQFFDNFNSILRSRGSNSKSKSSVTIKVQESTKILQQSDISGKGYKGFNEDDLKKMDNKHLEHDNRSDFQSAGQKQWAISTYRIRGPDF